MTLVGAALADVTITVNRDSTYAADSGNREYTWYRVFAVVKDGTYTTTGGGYDADGTPGTVSGASGSTASAFAYTASLAVANKLGTFSNGAWTAAQDQVWFTLTPIAGSDPQTFSVAWTNQSNDTDTAQAAANWLYSHQVWDTGATGSLTPADNGQSWSATGLEEGYYLLKGSEGQNLIAATTNITVNEKNSYPTVDKKQKDTTDGTYGNNAVNVKIGDKIYYQIEVKVHADANQVVVVTDSLSTGLTFDNNVVVTVGSTVADAAAIANDNNVIAPPT